MIDRAASREGMVHGLSGAGESRHERRKLIGLAQRMAIAANKFSLIGLGKLTAFLPTFLATLSDTTIQLGKPDGQAAANTDVEMFVWKSSWLRA